MNFKLIVFVVVIAATSGVFSKPVDDVSQNFLCIFKIMYIVKINFFNRYKVIKFILCHNSDIYVALLTIIN